MKYFNLTITAFIFLMLTFCKQVSAQHTIVYLIANPRTCMVELLRMMGERKDFKVMHIPANWAYCHVHNYLDIVKGWYREDAPQTYNQALSDILKESEDHDIFVGENTHTAVEFLMENEDFIKNPAVQFVCLISNPHNAIISYYEKKKNYFDQLPEEQLSQSIGFKDLYLLLDKIRAAGCKNPLILVSKNLYDKTELTVQTLCDYLKIPFKKEALQWANLWENFAYFPNWYTIERTECAKTWHEKAIKSTTFTQPELYALDEAGNPTFEEIENLKHREICRNAYEENIKFYRLLLEQA